MKKIFIIIFGLYQKLHWCQPSNYVWHPIVDPYYMLYFKGSQQNIINCMLTPMQQSMNHKCANHLHYCLDSALWLVILMLCNDTKKVRNCPFSWNSFLKISAVTTKISPWRCLVSVEACYHIYYSKNIFYIAISPAQRETWF